MKTTQLDTGMLNTGTMARPGRGILLTVLSAVRKGAADRALHRQLCDMDDSLLRDIGLGQDEIYRVRQGGRITPRSWR